jgi:hypothetical protein
MQKQNHGKKSKKPSLISIEPGNDDDLMSLKKIKINKTKSHTKASSLALWRARNLVCLDYVVSRTLQIVSRTLYMHMHLHTRYYKTEQGTCKTKTKKLCLNKKRSCKITATASPPPWLYQERAIWSKPN